MESTERQSAAVKWSLTALAEGVFEIGLRGCAHVCQCRVL